MKRIESTQISKEFKRHLTADNQRIIFSGEFGSGKTYFLNDFFVNTEENKEKYEYFRISPVNYVVSSNEDIFELIKFNIVIQIIAKNLILENEVLKTTFVENLKFYIENRPYDFVTKIVECVPKVGEEISKIAKNLLEIAKEVNNIKTTSNKSQQLENYLKSFENKNGTYLENDLITSIIQETIGSINKNKKSVLVIDDLDRIDPQHIFRILNIFSAYFDLEEGKNKFKFSHIIIVCDIQNIRNIYHAKYGSNVDFNGYIDKFRSKEVFRFNLKFELSKTIDYFLNSIQHDENHKIVFNLKSNTDLKSVIAFIIELLINSNQINIRHFKNLYNSNYHIKNYRTPLHPGYTQSWNYMGVMLLDFLEYLLGSSDSLKKALENCKSTNIEQYSDNSKEENIKEGLKFIIPILGYKIKIQDEKIVNLLKVEIDEFRFEYKSLTDNRNLFYCSLEIYPIKKEDYHKTGNISFLNYLLKAYDILLKIKKDENLIEL